MSEKDVIAAALEVGSSTLRVMAALMGEYAAIKRRVPSIENLADKIGELERETERGRNQDRDLAGEAEASQ